MFFFRPRRLRRIFFTLICIFFICFFGINNLSDDDSPDKSDHIIDYRKISLQFDDFIRNGSKDINLTTSIGRNVSNIIGGYRNIPDTRDNKCRMMTYTSPIYRSVSVIITFHNEERSTLLRTITSILWRTNIRKVREIILIDDFSDDETIIKDLEFLPTKLFRRHRNSKQLGIFQSRNYAAKLAKGYYIVFLDSRCEVNKNWLEPLLARMVLYPGIAVSPSLDVIDPQTLSYTKTESIFKGGFDWTLNFKWILMSEEEREKRKFQSDPYVSPSIPGGIFMISRNWFFSLKGFNPLLEISGDEGLEMSLKIWLCGGIIEIVPCSRVGHIFIPSARYTFPKGADATHLWNSKIVAESWLDEYKFLFYLKEPEAKSMSLQNNFKNSLKKYLQCKPFSWYLKNVFSELTIPVDNHTAFGKLNCGSLCLKMKVTDNDNDMSGIFRKEYKIYLEDCRKGTDTEWFLNAQTQQIMTDFDLCLSYFQSKVIVEDCRGIFRQKWIRETNEFKHRGSGFCLDTLGNKLTLRLCRRGIITQIFNFSFELNHSN